MAGQQQPLPEPPAKLKAVQTFMKTASEVERTDPVVAYWLRLYSIEKALTIDKGSPECVSFLSATIEWLENFKRQHKDNEAVSNQTVGQAHYENFAMNLFNKTDTLDRGGDCTMRTVRMFFMASILFDAMSVFGPLEDEIAKRSKYAKFKAAYITKCLKTGQTPKPGPVEGSDLESAGTDVAPSTVSDPSNPVQPFAPPPPPAAAGGAWPSFDDSAGAAPATKSQPASGPSSKEPFIMTPSSAPPYLPQPSKPPTNPAPTNQASSQPPSAASNSSCPPSQNTTSTILATKYQAMDGSPLSAEDLLQSQKYCKFANSALQYDDVPTAVANLEKALKLLTTGKGQ